MGYTANSPFCIEGDRLSVLFLRNSHSNFSVDSFAFPPNPLSTDSLVAPPLPCPPPPMLPTLVWARAILLTTPTVATVGCSLTIPIAFASDFLLHGNVPKALAVLGATLVVGGFYFVSGREDSGGGHGGGGGGGGGCRGGYASACCARRMGCLRRQRPKPDA